MADETVVRECENFVGRMQTATDPLSSDRANGLLATLDDPANLSEGDPLPPLFHWLYFNATPPASRLKADGHEKLGTFLPPVPFPGRMWASSEIAFQNPLILGQETTRTSTIKSVTFKNGRSGPLCFVAVGHAYSQGNTICLTDTHSIVYRETSTSGSRGKLSLAPANKGDRQLGAIELFRYSALTFNSHRIHYDADYVREEEGYPGLVVHGPLIATLMMRHGLSRFPDMENTGQPATFSFKGHAPLISGEGFRISSQESENGLTLSCVKSDGVMTTTAELQWR